MRPNLTYIVSGTRAEFDDYMRQKMLDRTNGGAYVCAYVYVDSAMAFRGKREVHGFYIGTYEKRADIEEIRQAINIANYRPFKVTSPLNLPNSPIKGWSYEGVIVDEIDKLIKNGVL